MYNRNGIGMNAIDKKAKRLLAQSTPNLWNIALANNGNPAPKEDLMKSLPARTDAATSGYASGR